MHIISTLAPSVANGLTQLLSASQAEHLILCDLAQSTAHIFSRYESGVAQNRHVSTPVSNILLNFSGAASFVDLSPSESKTVALELQIEHELELHYTLFPLVFDGLAADTCLLLGFSPEVTAYSHRCLRMTQLVLERMGPDFANLRVTLPAEVSQQHTALQQTQARAVQQELLNRDLLDSLAYAQRIQATLLPDIQGLKQYFSDAAVMYRPRDILSGDFYWWHALHDKLILVAADCTGHGVPGAMVSFLGINLLHQIRVDLDDVSAAKIINLLNFRLVCSLQPDEKTGVADGMDLICIVYDPKSRQLEYCGANQNMGLIRNGNLEWLSANKFSVGGWQLGEDDPLEREFISQTITLQPGDRLILCTDGLQDQFGVTAEGAVKKFGSRRLDNLLVHVAKLPANESVKEAIHFLQAWQQDQPQTDDQLMMCLDV